MTRDSAQAHDPPVVLVVDDDAAVGKVLGALVAQAGMAVESALSGDAALALLGTRAVDVVLTDLRMPGMDGMELLRRIKSEWPDIPVVMLTAHGTVPQAVEAMKRGAADFILKPFDREEILFVLEKALSQVRYVEKRGGLVPATLLPSPKMLISRSASMLECDELLTRAARGTATVLLCGETGSGKEVAAHLIHARSPRASGPFIVVHAAAFSDTLLESELFGHEKGAFTGAVSRKPGRFEMAAGGTVFFDEIGDISPLVQVKLLRVIQERAFERVGGTQTLKADVRFVAATHRDLDAMVAAGEFREDLLFRLNVIRVRIPALRQRRLDIAPLASQFCARFGPENGRPEMTLDDGALALLSAQAWPGNVRQLQNFMERLVVMSSPSTIDAAVVEKELARQHFGQGETSPPVHGEQASSRASPRLDEKRREAEKTAVLEALRKSGNNRTKAARILGVGRRTLYNKLQTFGVD